MEFDVYRPNGEWDLIDYGAVISYRNIEGEGEIQDASFFMKLARKPTYYILNVLVPRWVNNKEASYVNSDLKMLWMHMDDSNFCIKCT